MKLPGISLFRKTTLSDVDLAQEIARKLNEMYKTGQLPERYIPARPNEDFDILVGELIQRFIEGKSIDLTD